jgi:type I restriction enzyme, R subunit
VYDLVGRQGESVVAQTNAEVRAEIGTRLQTEVVAMNLDNFIVRPHRRRVEKFAKPEAWKVLSPEN